jgi:GGDEF domain-containing protein
MLLTFRGPGAGRARSVRAADVLDRETARLQAVSRFATLGQAAVAAAERGAQAAAALLDANVGLCTLVERHRVRVVAQVGLDAVAELPREPGLCVATVSAGRARIVERADLDRRTCAHSLVRGPASLRFYAGVPLRTSDGFDVGTLAAASRDHRFPEPRRMAALEAIAAMISDAFEAAPPVDPPVDPVTGLPGRVRLREHLARLALEPAWRRSWGAVAAIEIDPAPARDERAGERRLAARALRGAVDGDVAAYAAGDCAFALVAGVGCEHEPSIFRERIERALRHACGAIAGRASVGVATYDERASAPDAYRLAQWRAYAEKAVLR